MTACGDADARSEGWCPTTTTAVWALNETTPIDAASVIALSDLVSARAGNYKSRPPTDMLLDSAGCAERRRASRLREAYGVRQCVAGGESVQSRAIERRRLAHRAGSATFRY